MGLEDEMKSETKEIFPCIELTVTPSFVSVQFRKTDEKKALPHSLTTEPSAYI